MNILFLTIGRFESIESHSIYADLLRCFRNHGHEIYTICPYEKRTGNKTELVHENGAHILHLETKGVVIAAAIMLATNGCMNYHLSGSLKEYIHLAPTNLLLYEAALWGCANGYRTLYLGGGVGSGEDSLFKFKRGFYRGDLNHFYIGKKIYNQDKYDELLGIRKEIENPGYFPKYRGE